MEKVQSLLSQLEVSKVTGNDVRKFHAIQYEGNQLALRHGLIFQEGNTSALQHSGGSRGRQRGVPRLAEVGKIAMYRVHTTSHVLFLKILGVPGNPRNPPWIRHCNMSRAVQVEIINSKGLLPRVGAWTCCVRPCESHTCRSSRDKPDRVVFELPSHSEL